ncbi:MAG: tyrosine-type recombinase/integrase [Planctomycetaceae bacterium]
MSRYELSKLSGIDKSVLSKFVHGKCGLSMQSLDKIGELLDLQITKIEAILASLLSRRSLAAEVAEWVGNVPEVLAEKLGGVGLIAPREKQQRDATMLGEFVDAYLASRTDIKPRTRINLLQVRRNLVSYFGETKPIADITPGDTDEWRLIFALARFGGLRTPSETLLLRWDDVDWERGRLLIRSPKTEHHERKDSRFVPIFPELLPHLEAAWDQAAEGAEFVIARRRDSGINLRTHLLRIIAKAGLTAWPKLFQNLRSTRETELAKTYPLHVVTSWLGNSQLIAAKHYLRVTDDHFQKATQNPTPSGTEMAESDGKPIIRPLREKEKAPEFPGLSAAGRSRHIQSVPPQGAEQSQDLPGNLTVRNEGDSQSDSLVGVSDPRLALLIEVWPTLTDDVQADILKLAGLPPDDFNDVTATPAEVAGTR